jgi:hypothetical protein
MHDEIVVLLIELPRESNLMYKTTFVLNVKIKE